MEFIELDINAEPHTSRSTYKKHLGAPGVSPVEAVKTCHCKPARPSGTELQSGLGVSHKNVTLVTCFPVDNKFRLPQEARLGNVGHRRTRVSTKYMIHVCDQYASGAGKWTRTHDLCCRVFSCQRWHHLSIGWQTARFHWTVLKNGGLSIPGKRPR